jgi:signal transduction histidine kinase
VLLSCVAGARGQADEKNIRLITNIPADLPLIDADKENMEKVFNNLLSNAIKYTPAGGTVKVSASDFGTHLQISVADTGIGIAPEALPHIFERFYRVKDEKTREILGTGLGLTIVKNIVDAHMGTIHVESEVGKGSTFTVLLPKHKAAAPVDENSAEEPPVELSPTPAQSAAV